MNILFVVAHYFPHIGGAELVFQRLAEGLVNKGHKVKVVTICFPGTKRCEIVNGVEVKRIKVPFGPNPFLFAFFCLPYLFKIISKFELVQISSSYSALPGFVVAKIFRKKLVITCHEVLGERWRIVIKNKFKAWLYRYIEKYMMMSNYDKMVCVSNATQKDLLQLRRTHGNSTVIYNGVDKLIEKNFKLDEASNFRIKYNVKKDEFVYLYYGRPGITKGVEYLVRAVQDLNERIPNSRLVLILSDRPEKPYRKTINLINELGLESKILLVPSYSNRQELINNLLFSDCIVIPSLTEGFGLTTAESCTLGIPVVASNVGAIPEVISGEHILVEPKSSSEIVRGVIRAWNKDFDFIETREFSWSKMVDGYEQCYLELL